MVRVVNPATGREWGSVEQYVRDPKKYGGGGRGNSGGRSFSEEFKRREAANVAVQTKNLAQQKAQDAAQAKLLDVKAKQELNRIAALQAKIIRERGRVYQKKSRDVVTGNILNITTYVQNGNKVTRVFDTKTGDIRFNAFAPSRAGGGVRRVAGVVLVGKVKTPKSTSDLTANVSIHKSSDPRKLIVTFLNSQKVIINSKGVVIVGSRLAGHKYTFENGVIIAVDGKSTFARDDFVIPPPEVQYIPPRGSFWAGLQKTIISKRFRSKKVAKDQEKKEKKWDDIMNKMKRGEKLNQTDVSYYKEIAKFTPEKLVDKDVARFAQVTGGVIGTIVAPVPGAIIWAMGDTMEKVRTTAADGKKVSKSEFGKIVLDSATRGAILGFSMKILGGVASLSSKRVLLTGALQRIENNAIRSAINHGGILIKLVGRSGKNFITTYFLKDMAGNVFDVTREVKAGNFNNALRKTIETGGSIGGYIGGAMVGGGLIKGHLFLRGKLKPTRPEFAQMKTQLDVMSKQLLSKGKIVLTRRGVYETGKGLSPRKDAWLDTKVKNPTKSVFWRFDKTLDKKDQVISPLPLFTKSKTGYFKMFGANWKKNKGLNAFKRYIKTTAETPLVEDVVIRKVINLKDIKNLKLRREVLRQYATTGKLNKATQAQVLKNPKFGISDKNREFGFHDENEFVTRTQFKFKGRKDISWTWDPTLKEYIPVVESLKTANRAKNFISILTRKKIITRTDAKFIADNYAIKTQFKSTSILPNKHSYTHMKQVEVNILKLMNKYPQYNSYWKKNYGSVARAREAMKQAMWHDIGKGESASVSFGTPHGLKVWNVWKAKLLPKGLKFKPKVAKAIKKHETLDPRKLWYKVKNRIKLITPEEKIVATADRLDLIRFGIKVDVKRLPLKDALVRLGIRQKDVKFPSSFSKIINRIKIDKGVTKADLKKLAAFLKGKVVKTISPKKAVKYKGKALALYRSGVSAGKKAGSKAPKNYNVKPKGDKKAYVEGYREGYSGRYLINYKTGKYKLSKRIVIPKRRPAKRPTHRPKRRPPRRPVKRPTRRPVRRPAKRPTHRPKRRPSKRPTRRPTVRPPKKKPHIIPFKLKKKFKKRTLKKAVPVFYVKEKRFGKIRNLTPRPLTAKGAKDFLTYTLDKNPSMTAYFEPLGKSRNVVKVPPRMVNYFSRNKHKFKPYKIRAGKKKLLRHGFLEKRKYALDQKGEKAIRKIKGRKKKSPVRKINKRSQPKRRTKKKR